MLANLANPWLAARLLAALAASALGVHALLVAARVLRVLPAGREGLLALERSGEAVVQVERRAELVASLVQVGMATAVANLLLLVLAADRSSASIRGAMCAYGVFASTEWGWHALGASFAATLACGAWLALHRFDLRLERPLLVRAKLAALLVVVPLLVLDLGLFTAFALELDFQVVASCCSVSLDEAAAGYSAMQSAALREGAAVAAAIGSAAAATAALLARRGALFSWSAAVLGGLAALAAAPAIVWFVAPHAYETPHHLCPFCLFRSEAGGLGYPLLAALLVGLVGTISLGVTELSAARARHLAGARSPDLDAALTAARRRIGTFAAVGWGAALVLATLPVVRYTLAAGGASLFG